MGFSFAQMRGPLCVLGSFLINLTIGTFYGTIGNLLPYFVSYKRQFDPTLTTGDMSVILPAAGIAQGLSYLISGSVIIPMVGARKCLLFGCMLFVSAPILTYFVLDESVSMMAFCYGSLSGIAANLIMIPITLIPVTWFPNSKGKVVGFTTGGFGLSGLFFNPIVTYLINPDNIPPVTVENQTVSSNVAFFTSPEVLSRIPTAMLYMAAIYASMMIIGVIICVENNKDNEHQEIHCKDIKGSFKYLFKLPLRSRDFYFLFLTRYLMLVIGGCMLSHWKAFSLQLNKNDRIISIVGGGNGLCNALSRLFGGCLVDRFQFCHIMPVLNAVLFASLLSMYWVSTAWFPGFVILLWTVYLMDFSHFSTVPTQVIRLFDMNYSSTVLGGIGFADTCSYLTIILLNNVYFNGSEIQFLQFFISMAGFAAMAGVISLFVRSPRKPKALPQEPVGVDGPALEEGHDGPTLENGKSDIVMENDHDGSALEDGSGVQTKGDGKNGPALKDNHTGLAIENGHEGSALEDIKSDLAVENGHDDPALEDGHIGLAVEKCQDSQVQKRIHDASASDASRDDQILGSGLNDQTVVNGHDDHTLENDDDRQIEDSGDNSLAIENHHKDSAEKNDHEKPSLTAKN